MPVRTPYKPLHKTLGKQLRKPDRPKAVVRQD